MHMKAQREFAEILKEANLDSASHLELGRLVGLSRQRITQLIQGMEEDV